MCRDMRREDRGRVYDIDSCNSPEIKCFIVIGQLIRRLKWKLWHVFQKVGVGIAFLYGPPN